MVLPLRIGVVWLQRRVMFGESFRSSLRVSLALAPTLIFTLVLAAIMRERFQIPAVLFGALLLYAALTTLLPSLVFRTPFDLFNNFFPTFTIITAMVAGTLLLIVMWLVFAVRVLFAF